MVKRKRNIVSHSEKKPESITDFLYGYNRFLWSHGLVTADIAAHATQAKAFLVKQIEDVPFMLKGYLATINTPLEENRARWSVEEPLRVLPLSTKERELFIGAVATTGNTTALRLRNAALVSLLMCDMPRGIRPDNIRRLMVTQLWMKDDSWVSWSRTGAEPGHLIQSIEFDKLKSQSRVQLDTLAQEHLTRYVNFEDGFSKIKHWGSEFVFVPIGTKGALTDMNLRFISRQTIWKIVRTGGKVAGITGLIFPDILREQPIEERMKSE